VFVELPSPGDTFSRMDVFGTIEAVKAVSDLYSPLTGEIVAVNEALAEDPALVNSDPYGEGWMVRIRASDPSEIDALLAASDYAGHVDG
jgi:glycine cleavage system H protein